MTDELINVAEAARRLGRTEAQLRWQMIQPGEGRVPLSAMVAGRRMFRASDVQRFIDDAFHAAVTRDTPRRSGRGAHWADKRGVSGSDDA